MWARLAAVLAVAQSLDYRLREQVIDIIGIGIVVVLRWWCAL